MKGKWTVPGQAAPSSHLIVASLLGGDQTRCGRRLFAEDPTDEPPAQGKTCETCLRLASRDG